jgi:hypothetical protein
MARDEKDARIFLAMLRGEKIRREILVKRLAKNTVLA